jgi:ribosomal protein S18 acetylase RimI-like enzyme
MPGDQESTQPVHIRRLTEPDPQTIASAFAQIGWGKPIAQYRNYLAEQSAGTRVCLVAAVDEQFAGYITVNWAPTYPGFVELSIPEIQDLNVLPRFRRRGIGTRLLDEAEQMARQRCSAVGIGVGLHPGYNAAQRLYVKRGYVPDGRGVTCRDRYVEEGAQVMLDDDLVLHLIKQLPLGSRTNPAAGDQIRPAMTSDIPGIRTLMQTVAGFWQPWWSDETIAAAVRSANGLAFVWEDNSQILGFVCAHDLGFRAYLSELVVDTNVRNRGIGRRLVQTVEEALRARNQRVLIADVWHDAEPFYRSLGWAPPDAVLLRRRLNAQD